MITPDPSQPPVPATPTVPSTSIVSTTPPAPPDQQRKEQLDKAFEGINYLVLFSCRNAVPPTGLDNKQFSELLGRLTSARELHLKGQLDKDTEVQFFADFSALTAAFKPVTIGSLQDSQSNSMSSARKYFIVGGLISKPTSIVRRFSICSVISLVALLYAQIVWISGSTILSEFQKVSSAWTSVNNDLARLNSAPDTKGEDTSTEIRPQGDETKNEKMLLQQQMILERKADAFVNLVDRWGVFTLGSVALVGEGGEDLEKNKTASLQTSTDLKFASTAIVLNIYATYMLPLLYGLMGACCYMLRQIILEIRQKTYRSDFEMSYWVRLFLGVLAGLAIGWFLRSEPETVASSTTTVSKGTSESVLSLAPMALSFLAGYSVELLFSAMDRLVAAFGSKSKESPS